MDRQQIEIVGSQPAAEDLDRIANTGKGEQKQIFCRESVEKRLALAVMLVARRGYRDVDEVAFLVAGIQMQYTRRLFERQAAQEQIVYQAKNRGVQPDPERKRHDGDECESGRFK